MVVAGGKSFNIPIVLVKEKEKLMATLLAVQNEQAQRLPVLAESSVSMRKKAGGGGVETELLLSSPYLPSGEVNAGEILLSALLAREAPLHYGV